MAQIIETRNFGGDIAARLLLMLNFGKIRLLSTSPTTYEEEEAICSNNIFNHVTYIVTDTEPKDLLYPENWYYAKGSLRNKYMCSTGAYSEIPMYKSDGTPWERIAKYCTNND